MVVDDEFYSLLNRFDGKQSLGTLLEATPNLNGHKRELLSEIGKLVSLGILNEKDSPLKSKRPNKPKVPIESIAVNITRQCNLRCKYCYNHNGHNIQPGDTNSELTADEIIGFLKQLKPFLSKNPSLNILGGEPLLDSDKLLEVSRYAGKQGFNTLVSTNGTSISNVFAKQARKIGLDVQISVDGHNADLNDPLRGQGVFKRAEDGVRILVENKVHTIVSMVCCEDNFPYLEDYYQWAKSMGVNEARFIPLKNMGSAGKEEIKPVSTLEMIKKALQIFSKNSDLAALAGRDCFSIIANTCKSSNKRVSCGTGLQTLLLDADGSIYPCLNTNMPEFKIADIRDESFSFKETWELSPVLQRIRTNSSIETMNKTCSSCVVRYWCLGGCRGETYVTTGRLDGPSNNCLDHRKSILEMFWILSEYPDIIRKKNIIG